eukprot:jgi/Psemu1/66915/estExt_Genemark1.C_2540009
MKFTIATSHLVVATTVFALVSTEATSLRGKSLIPNKLLTEGLESATQFNNLRRHLEEANENDDYEQGDDAEEAEAEEDEENADDDQEEQADDNQEEQAYDNQEEQADDEGDDYVFYDDEALQNCEEGDEDCEMAAKYTAYDDEYLTNCEEDDEECNDAAAYITAKQKKQKAENSGIEIWTKKYNSMSRTSQIWAIVLSVWFSVLVVTTSCLCCCRKSKSQKESSGGTRKSLQESLMGQSKRENQAEATNDEQKRGRSKFRTFGKKSKSKRGSSTGPFE